jgi:hypothetical protein
VDFLLSHLITGGYISILLENPNVAHVFVATKTTDKGPTAIGELIRM